jgi:signal transduction histidine kinase
MQSSNRHVLDATARIDSPKIRKAQLKCQPVSNAIPLGGIGLSISRSIIEAHDGKMWAESKPGGARFSVLCCPW